MEFPVRWPVYIKLPFSSLSWRDLFHWVGFSDPSVSCCTLVCHGPYPFFLIHHPTPRHYLYFWSFFSSDPQVWYWPVKTKPDRDYLWLFNMEYTLYNFPQKFPFCNKHLWCFFSCLFCVFFLNRKITWSHTMGLYSLTKGSLDYSMIYIRRLTFTTVSPYNYLLIRHTTKRIR